MMKYIFPTLVAICSGCTTNLQSRLISDSDLKQPQAPSYYFLKRQDFSIKIERELKKCRNLDSKGAAEIEIVMTSTVRPLLGPDRSLRFAIPYTTLSSGMKSTTLTINFHPDRTIKSINASAEDKTKDVIAAILNLAGTVATAITTGGVKIFGLGGQVLRDDREFKTCPNHIIQVLTKRDKLKEELRTLAGDIKRIAATIDLWKLTLSSESVAADTVMKRIIGLQNKQDSLLKQVEKKKEELASNTRIVSHVGHYTFSPDWRKTTAEELASGWGTDPYWFTSRQDFLLPESVFWQWFSADITENIASTLLHAAKVEAFLSFEGVRRPGQDDSPTPEHTPLPIKDNGEVEGILFREPVEADLLVCLSQCDTSREEIARAISAANEAAVQVKVDADPKANEAASGRAIEIAQAKQIYKGRFAIPQAGPVLLLNLKNGPFQNNNIEVVFSSDGKIEKFSYGDNAYIATALGALSDSSKTVTNIIRNVETADIERQKVENERLDAYKKNLELRKAIKDLRNQGFE